MLQWRLELHPVGYRCLKCAHKHTEHIYFTPATGTQLFFLGGGRYQGKITIATRVKTEVGGALLPNNNVIFSYVQPIISAAQATVGDPCFSSTSDW